MAFTDTAIGKISSVQRYKIISKNLSFCRKMIFLHPVINIIKHMKAVVAMYPMNMERGMCGVVSVAVTNGSCNSPNICIVKKYNSSHSLACWLLNSMRFTEV